MKEELRKEYLVKRQNLSLQEKERFCQLMTEIFINSSLFNAKTFHVFISMAKHDEVNTFPLINKLWEHGKTVVVPKMEDKNLKSCKFTPTTILETHLWGIQEPKKCDLICNQEIDVVVVPMLICDKKGNRIGFGGGYYDRFLPTLRADAMLVGINYFEPVVSIPIEKHDIALNALITPKGLIKF